MGLLTCTTWVHHLCIIKQAETGPAECESLNTSKPGIQFIALDLVSSAGSGVLWMSMLYFLTVQSEPCAGNFKT